MAISDKLLNAGEKVIVDTRTHPKALIVPGLWLIVVAALAGWLTSLTGSGVAHTGIWVVAAVLLLVLVVRPFLDWLSSTYAITDRRLITRRGVLVRKGHDIPLNRISDVSYERGLVDRMFGCGTLVISDASNRGRVPLHDVPHVEQLQLTLSNLLYEQHNQRHDDGT